MWWIGRGVLVRKFKKPPMSWIGRGLKFRNVLLLCDTNLRYAEILVVLRIQTNVVVKAELGILKRFHSFDGNCCKVISCTKGSKIVS